MSEADKIIADLELRGLGWSLDHTGNLIEARIWDWPTVIARYRPEKVEPLAKMLAEAAYQVDWRKYPVKEKPSDTKRPHESCQLGWTLPSLTTA